MADIRHRVGIAASSAPVYEMLTTTEGLAGWWAGKVEGDPSPGGSLRFYFAGPEPSATMEIVELTPTSHVGWRCVGGPDEWVGTELTFDLADSGDETVLLFAHKNWREPVEFMHHCSTKWAVVLMGLKAGFEGGKFTPYPHEPRISSWG